MEPIDVTRRQSGKIQNLRTGRQHKLRVKTRYMCHMLDVEDVNFHHDSAVLLPDYGPFKSQDGTTPEQDRITGLAVLYACFRHARANPDQSALVVGHTDRSGSTGYNQQLSELRADNVLFALQGNRESWVANVRRKSKVEDYQQILLWLTHSLGWDCDPGGKTNVHDTPTREAVANFQRQYNERFSANIDVDGGVGDQTWGAFFDVYMHELRFALGTDEAGQAEAQKALRFMKCEAIGCGEEFPITEDRKENYKTPIDRRVEILFFDPGEEPEVQCAAPRGACVELYEKKMYDVTPIEVEPLPLPSGLAVHVFLQCRFLDPDEQKRAFPLDCPVSLEHGDGTSEAKVLGPDGTLDFFVLREKQSFTLRFQFDSPTFLTSHPPDVLKPDALIKGDQVTSSHEAGHRLFRLPQDFRLADADWKISGAATYDAADGHFKGIADPGLTNIGSDATPVDVLLDPHWLYTRFEFFDRVFGHEHHNHERISTPPLMLEGFHKIPATGTNPDPDEQSNWIVNHQDLRKASQAIPWILKKDGAKPDNQVLIRFRTKPRSFIVSDDAATRRVEAEVAEEKLVPGPDRLKFYDLPEVWKSRRYHARPSTGDGAAFENLTSEQLSTARKPDNPLVFSLDDMVLTDENLNPLNWKPTDRCAIFSHKFGEDGHSSLTTSGLFEPDTPNKQSYLSKEQPVDKARNYVTNYANWTRVVAAQGNLCDVFDQRTPDVEGQVVGARAAVRWVDALKRIPPLEVWTFDASDNAQKVTGADIIVHPGRFYFPKKPDPITPKRPDGRDHNFFVVQPFFEQKYIGVSKSLSTGTYDFMSNPDIPNGNRAKESGIGRFDMVLLRCCDTDGKLETAVALKYFKFIFDFSRAPATLSGDAAQKQYVDDAVANIPKRWNGPDGSFNPGPPVVEQQDADANLHVKVLWFCQATGHAQAHYAIDVVPDTGRSFMNSTKGTGELRESAHKVEGAGRLVVAHECGHGGSLPDEYSERGTKCSYKQAPLRSNNIVTDFYVLDSSGMMNSNKEVRGRYFWHVAEWVRRLQGGTYKIRHDGHEFEVPLHPSNDPSGLGPLRSFVNWPLKAVVNTRAGGMVAEASADVLFYALGVDKFSAQLIKPGTTFDGIVVIQVKLKVSFPTKSTFTPDGTFGRIRSELNTLNTRLDTRFNNRWRVANASLNGKTFKNSLVRFSFRYLVTTITNEAPDANQKYLKDNGGSVASYNTLATTQASDHDVHLDVNVIDPPTTETSELTGKTLRLRSTEFNQFDTFVSRFLGLSTAAPVGGGPFPANAELVPLIQKVVTANAGSVVAF
jgi:hypothetical protein